MPAFSDLLSPLAQLSAACENATVALFVMDEHRHCVYLNGSAEALTGYSLDELRGRPLHDHVHHTRPDGRPYPIDECPIDRAAPEEMQAHGEDVFVHRDGRFYPVAFTASPVRQDGRIVGTVLEVRDITREKLREQEDVALRQLSELMLHELDLARMVQGVTDVATRLTGAQSGAFLHATGECPAPDARSGAVDATAFAQLRAASLSAPTFRGEGTICIEDLPTDPRYATDAPAGAALRSYLATPVKSDGGDVLGGLFFGHARPGAFTGRHVRAVEAIAALASVGMSRLHLFRRLEGEAAEKERLYQEAVGANRMKDEFLATISHELRTPLTSILGWSEMLASGRLSPEMVERAIGTIDRNARAQAQIIEDLLDISRIVSGKLRLDVREVDAVQPVEAAVEAVRPAALARDVHLRLQAPPDIGRLRVDPDRLQQVVWNLVTNAVKFTGRDGRVDVAMRRGDGFVEIRVSDTGRGIEADFLPRLFDRFSQVDASSTREHGGLGLGLSIVRHLVEMHGGSVRAESAGLGRGAAFVVRLPFSTTLDASADGRTDGEADVATAAPPPPGDDALAGCHVLLVEDDADSRAMLGAVLEAHGARVTACAGAEQALAALPGAQADIVVSDIGMPRMDGYAFLHALREWERTNGRAAVPAIALTAYARCEDRTSALAHGFQMHVAKPVSPSELVATVRSLHGWRASAEQALP
ncbi:MAG TPA: ATP-binding protein [Lysobacter sp.]